MNSFRKRKTLEPIMRFSDAHFHPKSFWMLQMKWAREQNNNKQQQQKKTSKNYTEFTTFRVPEKFVINFCCCSDCLFLVNKPFKIPVHVPICCANSTNLFPRICLYTYIICTKIRRRKKNWLHIRLRLEHTLGARRHRVNIYWQQAFHQCTWANTVYSTTYTSIFKAHTI